MLMLQGKRQLYGKVAIDSVAGPSEVLIVADKNNNPKWIAIIYYLKLNMMKTLSLF